MSMLKHDFAIFLGICTFFLPSLLWAQETINHPKKSYTDSLNRHYIQADLPLYVYVATSPEEKPTQLPPTRSEGKNELQPIYLDGHGKHYLHHNDAIHRRQDRFAIYADGRAPISSRQFSGAPSHRDQGQLYFGQGLDIALATKDEMSGIQNLYYSLNGQDFKGYQNNLSPDQEGTYTLKHYAVDNVGNQEKPQQIDFILDLSAPNTYHNIVGIAQERIISTSTKIYLNVQDTLSGIKQTYYYFDEEKVRPYRLNSTIPFAYLEDGEHTLYYYSVDQVENQETLKSFTFYLDKSSPIMSADVLGDRFIVEDKVYFSGRTKLKLTAVDNKSGIKQVLFSIDGGEYQEYQDPFYLPRKSGLHTIRYYAVDNIGNQGVSGNANKKFDEYQHNAGQVYVDLTGPILGHTFQGPTFRKGDTLYVSNQTQIQLTATDPESGLQQITYNIDDPNEELPYQTPFRLSTDGLHTIYYQGYDNVNNRNVNRFILRADSKGPDILHNFSNPATQSTDIYPSYVRLFLAATDTNTTIREIYYRINEEPERLYGKAISGFEKNKKYIIQVRALDILGNESRIFIRFQTDTY